MRVLGELGGLAEVLVAHARLRFQEGDLAAARSLFEEVRRVAPAGPTASLGTLPEAYFAALDALRALPGVDESARIDVRAETHVVLYQRGGDASHRDQAQHLLDYMSRHLSPAARDRFWGCHPVARALRQYPRNSASHSTAKTNPDVLR